jgi:hypothetical protein
MTQFVVTNVVTILIPLWGMIGIWTEKLGSVSFNLFHATIVPLRSVLGSTTYGSFGLSKPHVCLAVILYSHQGVQCDFWPLPGALLCILSGNDGRA